VPTHIKLGVLGFRLGMLKRLEVTAPLSREVDFRKSFLDKRDRQVHIVEVEPADEVSALVHCFYFHFNLHRAIPINHCLIIISITWKLITLQPRYSTRR